MSEYTEGYVAKFVEKHEAFIRKRLGKREAFTYKGMMIENNKSEIHNRHGEVKICAWYVDKTTGLMEDVEYLYETDEGIEYRESQNNSFSEASVRPIRLDNTSPTWDFSANGWWSSGDE